LTRTPALPTTPVPQATRVPIKVPPWHTLQVAKA
jgi:hypothetical protein